MALKPTTAQEKIYEFIETGNGNGIIDAVAGAGKTTTLMGCVEHVPNINDVLYCAFNVSIRKELQKRFHKANKPVKVFTIHSLGFQMLRATRDFKDVDDIKYNKIVRDPKFFETIVPFIDDILDFHQYYSVAELKEMEERGYSLDWIEKNALNEGLKYIQKILSRLLNINQKYRCTLASDTANDIDYIIRHFGIFDLEEYSLTTYSQEVECYFNAHKKLLQEGNSVALSHGVIDYTDMLYLPHLLNLTAKKKYGFVFVDECQDLSRAQLYVVRQYLRNNGRLLAVGDPYQAIYGFAGADSSSFENVKAAFNCQTLGLTDCFRCPADVIKIAQSIREDIKGFKTDPGKIYKIPQREVVYNIKAGDLVICRTRKPLIGMALTLIKKGYKVKIHPDELMEFMGDYKKNFTPKELRAVLSADMIDDFFETARSRNEKRIHKENQNADTALRRLLIDAEIKDMESTLDFLKSKFFEWQLNTLELILKKLKHMLSNPSDDAIKISTIHRAKGLENDRVFILEYNKLPYRRDLEWENIQERNLHYVAVTRPKEELYLCEDELYTDGDPEAIEENNIAPAKPINVATVLMPETAPETSMVAESLEAQKSEETTEVQAEEAKVIKEEQEAVPVEPMTLIEKLLDDEPQPQLEIDEITKRKLGLFINFMPIQKIKKVPSRFYSFAEQEETPYPALVNSSQRAKYWSVYENLQDTEFAINKVTSSNYLDTYYINTPNGEEIYDGSYNSSGQYNFRTRGKCANADKLLKLFADESNYGIKFEYQPQNYGFEAVHTLILAECQELGIAITNVFSEQYAYVYCFKTPLSYASIKVFYNGKGIITSIMPSSTLGAEDEILNKLLETMHHLWQR